MSVRAYKLIKIESEDNPSFNLSHNPELVDYLDIDTEQQIVNVSVERIKSAIKSLNLDIDITKQLKKDIKGLDDFDSIDYYCY